jgi:dienelactone hydrolase
MELERDVSGDRWHRADLACPAALMAERSLREDDPLDDFVAREIKVDGKTKRVWVAGSGPAVIVMTEMPGISPHVARFARWVRDAGFTVYMPHLFGKDGAVRGVPAMFGVMARACISSEFRAFAANASSPVTQWLRGLAKVAHAECGGPGVGAIGMCFTGNFALSMMLEKSVLAPVLSQPSLPLGKAGGMNIAPDELATVKARMEADDLTVLAYRFEGDSFCRAERFAAYSEALGDRFDGRVLPDSAANPKSPMKNPHSVVTHHLIDEEGQPTRIARDEILDFFAKRLRSTTLTG